MNKNLQIYAGASILAGAVVVGGVALNSNLPKNELKENMPMETIAVNFDVAVIPVKTELEDGQIGYVIPEGFSLYQVDKNIASPEKLNITIRDKYTVYSYSPSEYLVCSLDGYIGVKSEYMNSLRELDYIKTEISLGNPEYTTDLIKLDHHDVIINPYFLAEGYELYDLTDIYENIVFPYVREEEGTVYGLTDEEASFLIGVSNSAYQTIQQLDPLKEEIENIYYQGYEKTSSRS